MTFGAACWEGFSSPVLQEELGMPVQVFEAQLSLGPLPSMSFGPGKLVSVYITLVSKVISTLVDSVQLQEDPRML
jgi:hypothetical protein